MRAASFTLALSLFICSMSAQSLRDISFGTSNTFDVITWNIEWFPKKGQSTADSVEKIIKALDAEIIALQEIEDTFTFNRMIKKLADFNWFYDPGYYGYLAYVYKNTEIEILDMYEIYTDEAYWRSLPRAPLVLEVMYREEKYIFINNHLKCCGDGYLNTNDDGDEEKRRLDGCLHIKQHIDTYLSEENVILLGDLNDLLTDPPEHNVFQAYLEDSDNYLLADLPIAEGDQAGWSYPGWPSHLDHIIITNELFDEFERESSDIFTIEIDDYFTGGFREYDETVSDHRPVGMKLQISSTSLDDEYKHVPEEHLKIYPNPSDGQTVFTVSGIKMGGTIEILNLNGQQIDRMCLYPGQTSVNWDAGHIIPGVYLVKVTAGSEIRAIEKLIITQ